MEQERIYVGAGRIIPTKHGDMPKISFHRDDINKMVNYLEQNNKDWINLDMKKRREPKGNTTHYLEVDTWEKPREETIFNSSHETKSDLPF